MSPLVPLAAVAWGDLLEVIVVGSIAGIGLAIAFAFLVRGVIQATTAGREGRTAAVLPNVLLAAVSGLACLAAVVFAVYEMING